MTIVTVATGEAQGFLRPMLDAAFDSAIPQVTGTPMPDRRARHRSVRHHVNSWMTGPEVEP